MCGIFAYKGNNVATNILLNGLKRLEYRGYDSAGIAVIDNNGTVQFEKATGKVGNLSSKILQSRQENKSSLFHSAHLGIAHTRRATHGEPSQINTHPHYDTNKQFFVAHNGIIENYAELKQELEKSGYKFYSDTDTEIIPALLAKFWDGDFLKTVEKVLKKLHGAYALAILCKDCPGELIAVKRGSPLVFGHNKDSKEFFISSDMQALAGYVNQYVSLHDGDLVHIKGNSYQIQSEGKITDKALQNLDVKSMNANKGGFEHFMLKEIYEQAGIIENNFKGRINFETGNLYSNSLEFLKDKNINNIIFVACGTSFHAGLLGAHLIEDLTSISCKTIVSSEYLNKKYPTTDDTLHVFLSQSGETADSIEVLKKVKENGGMTLGIVNTIGSTIADLTDCGFFLRAGVEIGVASTKAFTAQFSCLMLLSLYLGTKNNLSISYFRTIIHERKEIPNKMREILDNLEDIKTVAKDLAQYKNVFFLGRNYQVPVAQEASLKLKEISYIHSEAYPAGELKHGSLALIEEDFPCILFAPNDSLFRQNMSSLAEIKARAGRVLVVSDVDVADTDWQIKIPTTLEILAPYLTVLVAQLLSYYVALELDRDIDKPRNLAKSVTVK